MIAFRWNVGNKLTGLAFIAANISDLTFQIFASESTAESTGPKRNKNWTSISYLRRYSLVWCDYVRLLAVRCCYVRLLAVRCCYVRLLAVRCCYVRLLAVRCCNVRLLAVRCCYFAFAQLFLFNRAGNDPTHADSRTVSSVATLLVVGLQH